MQGVEQPQRLTTGKRVLKPYILNAYLPEPDKVKLAQYLGSV